MFASSVIADLALRAIRRIPLLCEADSVSILTRILGTAFYDGNLPWNTPISHTTIETLVGLYPWSKTAKLNRKLGRCSKSTVCCDRAYYFHCLCVSALINIFNCRPNAVNEQLGEQWLK